MIKVSIDETAYSGVAKGLVKKVIRSLITQLADNNVLDLSKGPSDDDLDLVFSTAFSVLVQFEDFQGHISGAQRHPVVVGFMSVPTEQKLSLTEPEEILISRRRSDLHGGVDDALIREVFEEIQHKNAKS